MAIYRPTTSYVVSNALTNAGSAYDNNSTTFASGSAVGNITRGADYAGFTAVSNPSSVVLTVDWSAATTIAENPDDPSIYAFGVCYLRYSADGGSSWTVLETLVDGNVRARAATQYPLSGVSQLSNLRIRLHALGNKINYYDPELGRTVTLNASASLSIYEISVDVVEHGVNLSHAPPGTGAGKAIYASNLWDVANGIYGTPSTSNPAVFAQDGANGFWFLDSYY